MDFVTHQRRRHYLPDDVPSDAPILVLQIIDKVYPFLPVCSVEVIHVRSVAQPEQRLASTDLPVKNISRDALSDPSNTNSINCLSLFGGIEMVNSGGVEEAEERDCGCLFACEYVPRNAFMGVPKAEDVLPFCLVGRVEVVHQPRMVSTIERDLAADGRADLLPERDQSEEKHVYAVKNVRWMILASWQDQWRLG